MRYHLYNSVPYLYSTTVFSVAKCNLKYLHKCVIIIYVGDFSHKGEKRTTPLKGGENVSVPFLLALYAVVTAVAVALFVTGRTKNKPVLMSLGFLVVGGMMIAAILLHISDPVSHEYRVVYTKNDEVVLIDDNDGNTKRYNLDEVIHENVDFQIGDQVVVITSSIGKPM